MCKLDHEELIVKVVPACVGYGELAHRLLAQWGHAPNLFGVERISNDWLMVVMENLCKRPDDLIAQLPRSELTEKHQRSESKAIKLLHDAGFVHGDLRDPNILCSIVCDHVWLIDFDWARQIRAGYYPADLNAEIQWPAGVVTGGLIEKEHDWAFHHLRYEHLVNEVAVKIDEVILEEKLAVPH